MSHRTQITVSWGDTDAGGLIYFPRFFHFVVVALNDYFQPAVEGDHLMDRLRRDGYVLPAVDASGTFEAPLRAGDEVEVETAVSGGETSLEVDYAIRSGDGTPVADGEVTFVLVTAAFDPSPLPEEIHACIRRRGDETAP